MVRDGHNRCSTKLQWQYVVQILSIPFSSPHSPIFCRFTYNPNAFMTDMMQPLIETVSLTCLQVKPAEKSSLKISPWLVECAVALACTSSSSTMHWLPDLACHLHLHALKLFLNYLQCDSEAKLCQLKMPHVQEPTLSKHLRKVATAVLGFYALLL